MKRLFSKISWFSLIFLGWFDSEVYGQKPLNPVQPRDPNSLVEVLNSDIQEGLNMKNMEMTSFTGNVIFRHKGVMMGTDKAIQNATNNTVEAFGNIKINQGDTLTIVGDTLFYEGNSQIATISGRKVVLRDKKVTLTTKKVIYNIATGMAFYPVSGTIIQDSSQLTSRTGYYNTKTKYFNYIGDVEITNPKFVICTDTMDYDTYTKKAIFKAETIVKGEKGDLVAKNGWYNIQTKESWFVGNTKVENPDYSLSGDTLQYDNEKDFGTAKGNVLYISKKDSLVTAGDFAVRNGQLGLTRVEGETLTKLINKKDTVYLASSLLVIQEHLQNGSVSNINDSIMTDSLMKPKNLSVHNSSNSLDSTLSDSQVQSKELPVHNSPDNLTKEKVQYVIASGNVQVYRKDFQSKSDSLVYNRTDSTIRYFGNPILWYKENQLKADSIDIYLKNDRMDRLELRKNCFIIQSDTIKNLNQLKGREVTAWFNDKTEIERIQIVGNAESKYFVVDENLKIVGLNTQQSSTMTFLFNQGELEFIKAYTDVDEETIPPHLLTQSKARFPDFEYRIAEKPNLERISKMKYGKIVIETGLGTATGETTGQKMEAIE